MKIGYNRDKYPEQRNIIKVVIGYNYIRVNSYASIIKNFYYSIFRLKNHSDTLFFKDFGLNKVDVLHFFNYISYSNTPWIVTFESVLPRTFEANMLLYTQEEKVEGYIEKSAIKKSLKRLAHPSCKKIIGMSKCAIEMQKSLLKYFPQYRDEIIPKLSLLHPPQQKLVSNWNDKNVSLNEEIRFMFVGGEFFRKGGREILNAFYELRNNNYNFKLIIISSLHYEDYASASTEKDLNEVKLFLENNTDWIEYHKFLPNKDVLNLMKSAHIGLLPTYADTYGYSVLEFQAAGCPVITTNIRALSEINNNNIGWVIRVPKYRLGEGKYANNKEKEEMSYAIKMGLLDSIKEIFDNKDLIKIKGEKALNKIEEINNPKNFSYRLKGIYDKAVS